jgi:hypothetical protein
MLAVYQNLTIAHQNWILTNATLAEIIGIFRLLGGFLMCLYIIAFCQSVSELNQGEEQEPNINLIKVIRIFKYIYQ